MEPVFDPYSVLGISPNSTEEEIEAAYRRLAFRFHPDRNRDRPEAVQHDLRTRMAQINRARETLLDRPSFAHGSPASYHAPRAPNSAPREAASGASIRRAVALWLSVTVVLGAGMVYISKPSRVLVLTSELRVAECFDTSSGKLPATGVVGHREVKVTNCREPHDGEVLSKSELSPGPYPGESRVFENAARTCGAQGRGGSGIFAPDISDWQGRKDRTVICYEARLRES